MLTRIAQIMLLGAVAATPLLAQGNVQRMWYRGSFDGWVEHRDNPAHGYYYSPSPNSAYPLNESAYGQPVPCDKCGHGHYPGQDTCPYCGRECPAGGNDLNPRTVYRSQRLTGAYYYQEQPHYRFASPMRLGGTYKKYDRPFD